jgi:hypothetical protein
MLSGDATNTNFIIFGFTQSGLEPTIYRTRGETITPPILLNIGQDYIHHHPLVSYDHVVEIFSSFALLGLKICLTPRIYL